MAVISLEPTDFGFTGQRNDSYIKLIQMGARWYDSQLGRFISPDTIVPAPKDPQNFNRYTYAANNPTRFTDPTGHCVEPLSAIVCVSAGALIVDVVTVAVAAYLIADTAQDIHQNLESIPAQGPEVPPLPGYGEGELARPPDPGVYNPGPTLGEVQVPPLLPGPPMAVEQPNTFGLEFPSQPINIPNISAALGKIKVKDLDPLHSPETSGRRPDLEALSDSELMDSVTRPVNRDPIRINTRTGKVVDGNGRAYELIRRANDPNSIITPDTEVPYEPHKPWSQWNIP